MKQNKGFSKAAKTIMPALLVIGVSSSIYAQSISEADLNRLIHNHPLMQKYDKNTGYFKDTDYDHKDISTLEKDCKNLLEELERLKERKTKVSAKLLEDSVENEDQLWKESSEIDKRIKEVDELLLKNSFVIEANGAPLRADLLVITDKLTEDSILPLHNKDSIILNRLPKYPFKAPRLNNQDLRNYNKTKEQKTLDAYLSHSYEIGLLFQNSNQILLYSDKKNKSGKIGTVDFSRLLALHPKMAMFDFDRVGFFKTSEGLDKGFTIDITTVKESREILDEIEKEVFQQVEEYAKKNDLEVVLNASTPNFEKMLEASGIANRNWDLYYYPLYYQLLENRDLTTLPSGDDTKKYFIHWLEWMRNPKMMGLVGKKNYPLLF